MGYCKCPLADQRDTGREEILRWLFFSGAHVHRLQSGVEGVGDLGEHFVRPAVKFCPQPALGAAS
jgi:hypothetical protein